MGLGERILGFVTAPIVGARTDHSKYTDNNYSAARDYGEERAGVSVDFGAAIPQQLVPFTMLSQAGQGDSLFNREKGTHTIVPGRALSAQTRLKNMTWELPAAVWTDNPEGPPYLVRVPGLPGVTWNLQTQTNFTTQPEYLQPLVNLQIQNQVNLMEQFRAAIFGQAQQAAMAQHQQNQQTMFPSIFANDISVNLQNALGSGAE